MIFQFKQFSVKHEKSAMKVGTDGNLLGAWSNVEGKTRALDIGSGTGLISLMIAQRNSNLNIDGLEIDSGAIEESRENVVNSPFAHQIRIIDSSFENFKPEALYDHVISNPPFFYNQSESKSEARINARQGNSDWKTWFPKISALLTANGTFDCIFPIEQKEEVIQLAAKEGLHLRRITTVFPKPHIAAHRVVVSFSKTRFSPILDELTIETKERHRYTKAYEALLKDYLIIF